jgi:hypothetical protein
MAKRILSEIFVSCNTIWTGWSFRIIKEYFAVNKSVCGRRAVKKAFNILYLFICEKEIEKHVVFSR